MALLSPPAARASVVPSGFQESTVFSGLVNPTNIEFARDGRVFVAQKNGQIKVFDNASDPSPDLFADLGPSVHDFRDRGLLGLARHPDFQPAGASVPAGYLADTGAAFGSRGNGFSYGWSGAKHTARDRNSPLSPDQRYDTLIEMEKGNKTATWELAVPNGTYRVHPVSGDPVDLSGTYRLNVEGRTAINGTLTSSSRWLEATVTVTVSDGRLTVTGAAGANGNKVNYLDIERPG